MRATLILPEYRHITFDDLDCEVFYKGEISISNSEITPEQWINSLIRNGMLFDSANDQYLYSEFARTSGLFSLVIRYMNQYFLVSDIIRCYPLFYSFLGDKLIITNNLFKYQQKYGISSLDYEKIEEYVVSGFVYGNSTIYKNTYAIQAGEIVFINDQSYRSIRYFRFKPTTKIWSFNSINEFTQALDKCLLSVFVRMIKTTPSVNRWLVPLSGGHDSRVIVNYLYRLGVRNVICFSYGTAGNEQSKLSKMVSESLGFEWHFVEYTSDKWLTLYKIGILDEYIDYAFNGVSTPHLQDFLAVYELKKNGVLKNGDVFVPGHTFDFLVGSNLSQLDLLCESKTMAVQRTLLMHSKATDLSGITASSIEAIYDYALSDPKHFQEYFNWQEQRSKFLVNAVRGYEFHNFKFRLPFWDKEIVDFWMSIPDDQRMERKVFLNAEKNGILDDRLLSIPFFGKNDRVTRNILENIIRDLLPGFLKTIILRLTGRKVKYNAGLNQIYELRASRVRTLLNPLEDFPSRVRPYFDDFLDRYPYQIDYHLMTTLYTLRKQLNRNKSPKFD
jgi:asparagine synthase (glutamine-hydrolysing)